MLMRFEGPKALSFWPILNNLVSFESSEPKDNENIYQVEANTHTCMILDGLTFNESDPIISMSTDLKN